uniref:Potassium channel domain-containing protein n=1 Tax=Ornithorhynchus anatinus TaxID=9258 RepID=A0A6I8MXI6_ORNAN
MTEAGRRPQPQRGCWKVCGAAFPHICLISSLVIYAMLGALIFSYVEGQRNSENRDYDEFLEDLWKCSIRNKTEEMRKELFKSDIKEQLYSIKLKWLAKPSEWSFLGSLFFCCTVFTTVGYGHIYPITRLGKYLCMFYALFGIPLMFLVLSDVGDTLATILSTTYSKFRKFHFRKLWSRFPCTKRRQSRSDQDSLFVAMSKSRSVSEEPALPTSGRRHSLQCQNEPLEARHQQSTLQLPFGATERCNSCPELDPEDMVFPTVGNIDDIGREMEKLDVPIVLIVLIVFAYISCAAAILPIWETELNFEEAFYFCFVTLTTIGFGDVVLQHPNFFMFFSIYIVIGMEIVFIVFKLLQNRLVNFYKKTMSFVTKGKKFSPF